ncbi:MAG: ferritin-like domain-containing protein [Pseudomonadota bacterium]|nr:ferritin-like domain-containing protein [Pseudomonadota bacterium]MEC7702534.1 ferritin-like domain-containing protein [Pseudomonadota bacterium]MEC9236915.1 ferritin-like domain-containing protein [Pseudomonadota bacterium]MED5423081.1 ferritin-like domain-containing protein [Pseudomonadota bacterium]MEE3322469.1 ferritin-like domain-containing protein [Pseudomonadota bacterium]
MSELSIEFNKDYTIQWWERLLDDEDAMNKWLSKLWNTEKNGFFGGLRSARKFTEEGSDLRATFCKIAKEEWRHSQVLHRILKARGITPVAEEQENSKYWPHVMKGVKDLQSVAAASAIGELLAAKRFEVIQQHPRTPKDILVFINQALPEEQGHFDSYAAIAGEAAMQSALQRHKEAIAIISGQAPK